MKIAIATSSLPPGFGISVFVDELSKCLYSKRYKIKVFVTDTFDYAIENYVYPVHFTKIPASIDDEATSIKEFYDEIMLFNPDVLLINDCIYASDILPALSPKCIRISFVHGYRRGFGFNGHRLVTSAAIYNFKYLDWVVGTSNIMCSGLSRDYRISSEMIKLIYNGINSDRSYKTIRNNKIDKHKKVIVFAGGSNPTKGSDVFLKAVKRLAKADLKNWKVIWIGGKSTAPKALEKSGLLDKFIEWHGVLPITKLREILLNSHILAMPSRAEACPMLLLDAYSMGVVPVVSDCPSAMREFVIDSKCGLVSKTGSAISLANSIIDLLKQPETLNHMSILGMEYFNSNLTINDCCDKLLTIIGVRRSNFNPIQEKFPFGKIHPFHRRKYKYSKWNPFGIYERWRFNNGILPSPLKIDQRE